MRDTKKIFKDTISEILNKQGTDDVLSEAALPAYAHKNPIIDYIFWRRLSLVVEFINKNVNSNSAILDFGCGTGVVSYELAKKGFNLTSIDLDLSPLKLLKSKINYPSNINFIENDFLTMNFDSQQFEAIIALDVLGSINGTIYLNGFPSYNAQTKEIYFDKLDYALDTKNKLIEKLKI